MSTPFWPDKSPHFLLCRKAVRPFKDLKPVIGLSGGADSLALVAAAAAEGVAARAICIDHGLQLNSDTQAARAATQAEALGIPAEVRRVVVAPGNIEAQARAARYQALREYGTEIWVAHTANDQAETLLMALIRGHASGMLPDGEVRRPFLSLRREETEGACRELGLEYWEDPMNHDSTLLRTRLRYQLLPLFKDLAGDRVIDNLAHAAHHVAVNHEFIRQQAVVTTDISTLQNLATPVRLASIRGLVYEYGGTVNATTVEAINALIMRWHGQGAVACGAIQIRRRGADLIIEHV
ncbi:tRNA lysidine(34) synthetase TilS [Corynebacterium sp. ES2794-CONJ1]|uniref:tRNA lysidine(34) synthetase TilS n=1 Tax=unclassified Corynebacterium TaxID=2624378 RepID=UPI002168E580|nr:MULTISPECIES: tRNA lysidine(34) synthetase TilS [unclassified Corynebacterium]MCS4490238.1 tRNA lysidine(34) synthetase TilS [Corynebacterium sp. ES2775-CONJ]MCS4491951.1 tRNA lysidine(34) synthetase TilS [Corynebacterium sp. ES2715-CONJ3]MCS4532056.1 tRNA lysidine(34) synthetase TilS [Corynebacterium sp. ES2730-CONJ]MCU9519457.1 tRNA lysidine(34) synthetase TilS [Corynebacterium sp. ES2794-CONJ1]